MKLQLDRTREHNLNVRIVLFYAGSTMVRTENSFSNAALAARRGASSDPGPKRTWGCSWLQDSCWNLDRHQEGELRYL